MIFAPQTQAEWLALARAELKEKAEQNLADQHLAHDLKSPVYISAEQAFTQAHILPELPAAASTPICFAYLPAPNPAQDTSLQTLNYLKTLEPQGIYVQQARPMEQLLQIHQNLDLKTTSLTISLNAKDLPEYSALLSRQFASVSAFQIRIITDPLADAIGSGGFALANDYGFIADFANQFAAAYRIICPSLQTSIYHRAGASQVQQIAFSLAHIVQTIDYLAQNGLSASNFWAKAGLHLQVSHQYMAEIAKIRALRLLVWQIARQSYKIQKPTVEFFAESSDIWFVDDNPENNLSRHTIGAMAAFLGGATAYMASPHSKDTKPAHLRNALNIGRLLSQEAHLDQARQAASGTYYLDYLTRTIAQSAWNLFLEIEQQGGLSVACTNGFVGQQIAKQQIWLLEQLANNSISVAGRKAGKDKIQEKIVALKRKEIEPAIKPFFIADYCINQ